MKKIYLLCCLLFLALAGMAETSPNGMTYTVKSGDLYFNDVEGGLSLVDADWVDNLVVPDDVNGKKVISIAESAFYNRTDIESIKIGQNLTVIDRWAFRNTESLTTLDLTDATNLKGIYWQAFANSNLGGEILFPEGIELGGEAFAETNIVSVKFQRTANISSRAFSICKSLETVYLPSDMQSIAGSLFYSCVKLNSIEIPASVTIIGESAFYGCTSLENVRFQEGSKLRIISASVFKESGLKSISFPNCLEALGAESFSYTKLNEVTLPDSLKYLKVTDGVCFSEGTLGKIFDHTPIKRINYPTEEMMWSCPTKFSLSDKYIEQVDIYIAGKPLESVTLPANTDCQMLFAKIGTLKYAKIPNSTKSINLYETFYDCKSLETVEIGAGTIDLQETFSGCSSLKTVLFHSKTKPSNQRFYWTFMNCESLEEITLPESVTILNRAFSGCKNLKSVNIDNIVTIDEQAFEGCSSLTSLYGPKVTAFGWRSFDGCVSLETIDFPSIVKPSTLSNGTTGLFSSCDSLRTVKLASIEQIDPKMFYACLNLDTIYAPNVKEIGQEAFSQCYSLRNFDFSNVTKIGQKAFFECWNLSSVNLKNAQLGSYAFNKCTRLKTVTLDNVTGGGYDFYGAMTVNPASLTLKGDINVAVCMFSGCTALEKVYVDGTLKRLGQFGFINCNKINELHVSDIDSYLTATCEDRGNPTSSERGTDLFINGKLIKELELEVPDSIRRDAFAHTTIRRLKLTATSDDVKLGFGSCSYCDSLKTVSLSEGVTSIEEKAFYQSDLSNGIELPNGLQSIGSRAFASTRIKEIRIPHTVTSNGSAMFEFCNNLRLASLSPAVINMAGGTFFGCAGLEKFIVPEGVESMSNQESTEHNAKMKYIYLPSSLKRLSTVSIWGTKYPTFQNLGKNVEIYCWASNPPETGNDTFNGQILHVRANSLEKYKAHGVWSHCEIIGDLDYEYSASGDTESIIIDVPSNPLPEDGEIQYFRINLYESGSTELYGTYEFDANGAPLGRASSNGQRLVVDNLPRGHKFDVDLFGYTSDDDLIHTANFTVSTGVSAVENVQTEAAWVFDGEVFSFGSEMMGRKLRVFDLEGRCMIEHTIADASASLSLAGLKSGIYIATVDGHSAKIYVK